MGKELPLARKTQKRQPVLLAGTGDGEPSTTSSSRDKRTQEPAPLKVSNGEEAEDIKAKGKSSRKAKGANGSAPKQPRRRRDNKDREQDRGDEGEHKPTRRSAQELGISHPGSYCDEAGTIPHYWIEKEKAVGGSLLQCMKCLDYIWLPSYHYDAVKLSNLIDYYGRDEGYCRYLNRHRQAKILMAKMQDLRKLEATTANKREFAKLADKILSDKEYDRKEE